MLGRAMRRALTTRVSAADGCRHRAPACTVPRVTMRLRTARTGAHVYDDLRPIDVRAGNLEWAPLSRPSVFHCGAPRLLQAPGLPRNGARGRLKKRRQTETKRERGREGERERERERDAWTLTRVRQQVDYDLGACKLVLRAHRAYECSLVQVVCPAQAHCHYSI